MPRFIALLATLLVQKSHRGPLSSSPRRLCGHCGRCKSSAFHHKIAKVRSCDLHLCSISLQMCPAPSNIDRSRNLMCPKRPFECQKHTNISFPFVKLTSVVVTCLVLSALWGPYWLKNHTVCRSRRYLVDSVAIVDDANP